MTAAPNAQELVTRTQSFVSLLDASTWSAVTELPEDTRCELLQELATKLDADVTAFGMIGAECTARDHGVIQAFITNPGRLAIAHNTGPDYRAELRAALQTLIDKAQSSGKLNI